MQEKLSRVELLSLTAKLEKASADKVELQVKEVNMLTLTLSMESLKILYMLSIKQPMMEQMAFNKGKITILQKQLALKVVVAPALSHVVLAGDNHLVLA